MKKEIVNLLNTLADLYEFKGENRFKVSAFRNGANIIRRLDQNIVELINTGKILDIKGIGKGIQNVIQEYYYNSDSTELNRAKEGIPEGIFEILKIRGLGIKKVKQLYNELNISAVNDLEIACHDNLVSKLKGFGAKIKNTIIEEIEKLREASKFLLLSQAENILSEHLNSLTVYKTVIKFDKTGDIRRGNERIEKIEVLVMITSYEKFLVELGNSYKYNEIANLTSYNNYKIIRIDVKIPLYFYIVEDSQYYMGALFYTTGSHNFLNKLPDLESIKTIESEEKIFTKLRSNFVIPEMRESIYFNAPENLRINSNLTNTNFKGLLHFHTTFSDGLNSLAEMVDEAKNAKYKYMAVCDHSKSAFYANGLNEKRILQQKIEIENLNNNSDSRVFHGIESDILNDGSLDYNDEYLKMFDFIVASIHSNFGMSEEQMTKRIIRAIENPYTDLIGHPTGRIILRRDGYKVDIKKVIDACSANDVAIELNANPHRLDLDWRNIYYAREKECKFAINPDAHSIKEIYYTNYGIKLARKAGLNVEEVINCYSYINFINFINRKITRINL